VIWAEIPEINLMIMMMIMMMMMMIEFVTVAQKLLCIINISVFQKVVKK